MERDVIIRLFDYMESKGLTQQQFADIIGVSRGVVNNWKTGTAELNEKRLIDIVNKLHDIDANYLIRGIIRNSEDQSSENNKHYRLKAETGMFSLNEPDAEYYIMKCEMLEKLLLEKDKQIKLLENMINKT